MEPLMAVVIGGLYAAALYLMLRRNIMKLVIGLSLLGNATNLLIFTASGLTRAKPPLVPLGAITPPEPYADPVPQALILTAIVIGFGLMAFVLVLVLEVYRTLGTTDADTLSENET